MVSSSLDFPCSWTLLCKKMTFVDFSRRTYNVLIHIFQMKHFLPKLVRHEVVENWILFKMRCGGEISDEVCESYAWSKFCWLLSREALIWKLWLLIRSWLSLKNHDQSLIKWWILLQNVDVDKKLWSLTVCWPLLTFCPI